MFDVEIIANLLVQSSSESILLDRMQIASHQILSFVAGNNWQRFSSGAKQILIRESMARLIHDYGWAASRDGRISAD
jgi:hypothetical protein